jgi:hypothetical protein
MKLAMSLHVVRPPVTVTAMRYLHLRALAAALCAAFAATEARADGPPTAVETRNRALRFEIPAGWSARPLESGLALEPPAPSGGRRGAFDESIVVGCEPFKIRSLAEEDKVEDLLTRLRAGQLASCDLDRRWHRERVAVGDLAALVVTYEGSDDAGMPAALRIAVLPDAGRVAVLTARMPLERMKLRAADLDAILRSMRLSPAAEEKALAARIVGTWRSDAAPGVAIRLKADGTFEEERGAPDGKSLPVRRGGMYDVIGREVRLRFDEGAPRGFVVEDEPAPGRFRSAGQLWMRE